MDHRSAVLKKGKSRIIKLPAIDPHTPVQHQLVAHLRHLILSGAIAEGARMPAQRALSSELKVSRNTVIHAYEALAAEGLVEGKSGAGTYVVGRPGLKRSPHKTASDANSIVQLPLQPGVQDLELFPIDEWRRVHSRRWRSLRPSALGFGDAAGWAGLRFILAQRVAAIRGLSCTADQIHIVPSTLAGLRLTCVALEMRGRAALVEAPGYAAAHSALSSAGLDVRPMLVDGEGADVDSGLLETPAAKLMYLTPASQFPTGAVLSRRRRQSVLRWARTADAWIVEDDYESDFVFEGVAPRPIASEEDATRVIYVNSLNNLFFPSLRLAFLVVPDSLVDRFNAARRTIDDASDVPSQMVVHDFMEAGYLAAHLRRCREIYGERRDVLRRLLRSHCNEEVTLAHQPIGLHVTAWLANGWDDALLRTKAAEQKLIVQSISDCHATHAHVSLSPGLFLGFAGFDTAILERAVTKLASLLNALRR